MLVPIEPTEARRGGYVDPARVVRRLLEFQRYKTRRGSCTSRPRSAPRSGRGRKPCCEVRHAGEEMLEAGLYDLIAAFKELLDRRRTLLAHEVEAEGRPSSSAWTSCWR